MRFTHCWIATTCLALALTACGGGSGLGPRDIKKREEQLKDQLPVDWGEYNRGKISLDEARDKISDAFGGIRNPSWYGRDK